jgi:peptidoglycan/LPS O-acetylase OafA/YrhL
VDTPPTKIKHRPLLDGTRGVMMAIVLGYHLDGLTKLPGAWVSMDFFFVLSGYLITTLLLKERIETGRLDLRRFFTRRVRRLGPALLVTLFGVFAVAGLLGGSSEFTGLRGDGLATLFYVANWRFILSSQSYFASFDVSPLRHAWSLAIEEQFYLLWPLLFLGLAAITGLRRRYMLPLLTVALLASALWMRHLSLGNVDLSRAYYGTDTRGQGLIMGVMLALVLWRERWDTPRARQVASWVGTVALGGLVVMMLLFSDSSRAVYTNGGFLLIAVTSAVFIFGCARAERGPLAWIFGNPVSRHAGMVSYAFYLWHWPVIVFMSPDRLGWTPAVLDLARVAVALVLAELTYRYVEEPIRQGQWSFPHQGRVLAGAFGATLALLLLVTMAPSAAVPPGSGGGERASGATDAEGASVLVLGDSLAWVMGGGAPDDYPYGVSSVFQAHCDIVGQEIFRRDTIEVADAECPTWPDRWAQAVDGQIEGVPEPDAVVVVLGLRQLFDLHEGDERLVVGSPEWEAAYREAVREAAGIVRSRTDAPILWFDVPCYEWDDPSTPGPETAGEEFDPDRIDLVNEVLADELAQVPDVRVVGYRDRVCGGDRAATVRFDLRPDGAHLTEEATADTWRWLQPQIAESLTR